MVTKQAHKKWFNDILEIPILSMLIYMFIYMAYKKWIFTIL